MAASSEIDEDKGIGEGKCRHAKREKKKKHLRKSIWFEGRFKGYVAEKKRRENLGSKMWMYCIKKKRRGFRLEKRKVYQEEKRN